MQLFLKPEQTLALGLRETRYRNAGHAGDDLTDRLLRHGNRFLRVIGRKKLLLAILHNASVRPAEGCRKRKIPFDDRCFPLGKDLRDLLLVAAARAEFHGASGLIQNINGLVGKSAVSEIPNGQIHAGVQRFIGEFYAVVILVSRDNSLKDVIRLLRRGLLDRQRLEPALKRRILCDVFSVLVRSRRADHAQTVSGE